MKVRLLLNAMDYGDAVSSCCIFIKKRCQELGIEAQIYAEFFHPEVADQGVHLSRLLDESSEEDILLHQFFNESRHLVLAEQFPGRRVLIYQNITPPEWFPAGSPFEHASRRGLDQIRTARGLYEYAVGASEFTRLDLERMGFPNTGVFPVLVDAEALRAVRPSPEVLALRRPEVPTFLFVGRVAPNKRVEDLLSFLAAYRAHEAGARLIVVGHDAQLPGYRESLIQMAAKLSLEPGRDFILTGKVPIEHLNSYYRIADAFLCMSEHEGFCVPLIESMAFGLPTFAYDATACKQTMGGGSGVFYDKDSRAVASRIAAVLGDPKLKAELLREQETRLHDFTPVAERRLVKGLLDRIQAMPARAERRGNPRVSVVINTYNRGEQLQRCLDSLEEQTYRDYEVVVVNGPSTDDTSARIKRFNSRIKLVQTDSRVLSISRNCGIQAASGDLVAFIDDDAIAHPDWLAEALPAFDDPEVGAVGGLVYSMLGGYIEFSNGQLDRNALVKTTEPEPGTSWDWTDGWLNTVRGCNCIFRRTALAAIGGFDERIEYYHDEADVVMRLRLAGFKTIHRPRAIVYHEGASSHNRSSAYDLNWFAIVKNGIYCPLKNDPRKDGRASVALRIARSLFKERFQHPWRWWRGNAINFRLFCRIELQCARGVWAGVRQGLNPSLEHSQFAAPKDTEFVPFSFARRHRLLSICLLSQGLPPEQTGGVATYTMTLATHLRDLGCLVHVIGKSAQRSSENRDGIWFHTVSPERLGEAIGLGSYPVTTGILNHSAAVCAQVLEIAARYGVDVVESSSWDSEGLIPVLDARIPVVIRVVTPLKKVMETQNWEPTADLRLASDLEREMLLQAAGVIFTTDSMRELIRKDLQAEPRRTTRIPFGMRLPTLEPRTNGAGTKKVLFVGRLEARKGIHVLLDAIPGVLRAAPRTEFEIVGREIQEGESIAEQWRGRYPEHRTKVRFHGEVTDEELSRHYETCDLLVAPSLYESFGLIYVEAMARGKAVVGTTAGGIPEVVQHGVTGILVPPGNVPQLEQAITNLVSDDDLRSRIANAGYRSYFENFSAEAMTERTIQFYQQTIRDWRAKHVPVWSGNFSTFMRGSDVRVEWDPEARQFALVADRGAERIVSYGPYMQLETGVYRAEFSLWTSEPTRPEDLVAKLDVFADRILAERRVFGRDCAGGRGGVFDLFVSVQSHGEQRVEFRVTTSGLARLCLRQIFVSRFNHAQ